jgi:hypothetical protein
MKNRLPILLPLLLALALLPAGCGVSLDNDAVDLTVNPATAAKRPPPSNVPFVPPADSLPPPRTDWRTSAPPPAALPGLATPHILTDAEKADVLRIVLEYPTTANWLNGRTDYRVTHYEWYALVWAADGIREAYYAVGEVEFAASGIPNYVNPNAYWYPGLTIAVGDWDIYQMQIAVGLSSGKVALADGPYYSLSSPGRFK